MAIEPESRFMPGDDRCPHPEHWHSTDGESTELEVTELIAGLVRGLQPRLVVETGAAFGQTTFAIALALHQNGHGELVTFEIDDARRDALPPTERVTVQIDSLHPSFPDDAVIDMAFFDSWPECRAREYRIMRKWMRTGTIVAFHDTRPTAGADRIPNGRSLREQITGLPHLAVIDLPTPRGLTLGAVK